MNPFLFPSTRFDRKVIDSRVFFFFFNYRFYKYLFPSSGRCWFNKKANEQANVQDLIWICPIDCKRLNTIIECNRAYKVESFWQPWPERRASFDDDAVRVRIGTRHLNGPLWAKWASCQCQYCRFLSFHSLHFFNACFVNVFPPFHLTFLINHLSKHLTWSVFVSYKNEYRLAFVYELFTIQCKVTMQRPFDLCKTALRH